MANTVPVTQKPILSDIPSDALLLGTRENEQGEREVVQMPADRLGLTVADDSGTTYSLKLRLINGKPAIEINQKEADENVEYT